MKLLNVGCGGNRPGPPWINLDCLRSLLKPGTPERINLDKEENYIDHDLNLPIPLPSACFDGILASHVIEHFDCWEAVDLLSELRRLLKQDAPLVVSVPNAEYFLKVIDKDTRENAMELFGEPISPDEPWHTSFFDYALFHVEHKQVLTSDSLQCLLLKAGLTPAPLWGDSPELREIKNIMNRRRFSLEVMATWRAYES